MKKFIRLLISRFFTFYSLRGILHGKGCKSNFYSKFTSSTKIGDNCHFNGMRISGQGNVIIGNNFHSGKNIRIITTFHNFDWGGGHYPMIIPLILKMCSLERMSGLARR